jgi:hypothetical protein
MVLQSSGTISLSDIQTEFGGSNPISISEYYAAAAGLPASGEISISDFYGLSFDTTPPVITLAGANPYLVPSGGSYSEPGATADGGETVSVNTSNLTSTIQTSGGNGDVVYSATDAAGNIGYAIRTVKYPVREPATGYAFSQSPSTQFVDPGWCINRGLQFRLSWNGTLLYSSTSAPSFPLTIGGSTYYRSSTYESSAYVPAYYVCPPAPYPPAPGYIPYGVYRDTYQ